MTRQELITEAKRLALALDEMADEIEANKSLSEFGVNRTTRDLRVARVLVSSVAKKLGEEATWVAGI